MIKREDIWVTDGRVDVVSNGTTYGVTYSDDVNVMIAIDMLIENLMKKELGVTRHDFIMKVGEYFDSLISDRESEEQKDTGTSDEDTSRVSTYGGL